MICGRCHCHPESEVIARASCRGSVRRRALVIEIPPRSFYFAECQTGPRRLVTFGIRGDAEPDCHAAVRGTIQGRLHNMRGGTRPPFCSRAGGHAAQDRQLRILSAGPPCAGFGMARTCRVVRRPAPGRRISRHVADRVAVRLPSGVHGNPAIARQFTGSIRQHGFCHRNYRETISHEAK